MKQRTLLFILLLLSTLTASAYDAEIDSIFYNLNASTMEATVTSGGTKYSGNVTIPETVTYNNVTFNVTSIGEYAFYACSDLTSVTIPNSVTSIGYWAFDYCFSLTSITIPSSVTSIDGSILSGCNNLTSIVVEEGNPKYDSRNNCNAIIETSTNKLIAGCKNTTIPNSVTSIGEQAFFNLSSLTEITIPSRVTNIGDGAFSKCSNLTDVYCYAKEVPTTGQNVFNNSPVSSGTLHVPTASIETYKATSPWSGFGCIVATDVIIDGVYYNLNDITMEATVTSGNTKYTGSVTIPESVTYNNVTFNVTSIGEYAFQACSDLTSVTIPNSVTSIGYWAFYNCSGLVSLAIPNSVTSIGTGAFYNCSDLIALTIPNSVTSIGGGAFMRCSGLTSIFVEKGNSVYDSRDNCNAIIETATNTLIAGCKNTVIPNSVTSIGGGAFDCCFGLVSLTIPNSVTSIGEQAFYACSGLTSVTIPNSVTSIGSSAFHNCSGLASVTIPNSVTSIGDMAFSGCRSLVSLKIPNSVTTIGEWGFRGCRSLVSVTIPNSVTSIGDLAFYNCTSLTDVYCYAERVPTTGQDVFGQDGYYDDSPTYYATLHVPAVSIEAYMETSPWNEFGEIVKSDYLDVADLNIKAGESNTQEISLNNCLTDLVGFQMDLTLPEGIGIDKTGCTLSSRITDNKQELTIGKLESGAYRITSTSLSLTPISGYEGTLLTLKLTAEDGCIGGQATISNIIFSTAESGRINMSDKTFDITILKKYNLRYIVDGEEYSTEEVVETTPLTLADEPTKDGYTFGGWSEIPETMPNHDVEITGRFYLYGDVNTDEAVNVVDVVDIARFVVATPSVKFLEKLADLNKDNTVNIADAVTLVNHIAGDQNFARATASSEPFNYDQCQLQLLSTQENALSLCLDGDADFTAFQFDAELPQGIDVSVMRINGQRKDGHQLLYNKVAENHYRVAVLSLSNAVFKSNEGELLNISIDGQPTDEISVDNILFVTKNGTSITFNGISLSGTVTGIADVHVNEGNNVIYDLQGRKLSKLQHGVNIVNGKKIVVK